MPYTAFRAAAEEYRYDVELLQTRFGVGFETVCHRLSTLQRAGQRGVPICERRDCAQRARPPAGGLLAVDPDRRTYVPYPVRGAGVR